MVVWKGHRGHTLRFRQISVRACTGREAVGPVVLIGQQRWPFPVCHRSLRTQAFLPTTPRGKCICGGWETPRTSGKDLFGGVGVRLSTPDPARGLGYWQPHDAAKTLTKRGNDTTKTSVTWFKESGSDGQRARPMNEPCSNGRFLLPLLTNKNYKL